MRRPGPPGIILYSRLGRLRSLSLHLPGSVCRVHHVSWKLSKPTFTRVALLGRICHKVREPLGSRGSLGSFIHVLEASLEMLVPFAARLERLWVHLIYFWQFILFLIDILLEFINVSITNTCVANFREKDVCTLPLPGRNRSKVARFQSYGAVRIAVTGNQLVEFVVIGWVIGAIWKQPEALSIRVESSLVKKLFFAFEIFAAFFKIDSICPSHGVCRQTLVPGSCSVPNLRLHF